MVETPGICRNGAACQVAARGDVVTVPLGAPFVCPDCGTPLAPPVQHTPAPARARSPMLLPALGGSALLLAGGALFAGRMLALRTHDIAAQTGSPANVPHREPVPRAPVAAQAALPTTSPAQAPPVPVPAPARLATAEPPKPAATIQTSPIQSPAAQPAAVQAAALPSVAVTPEAPVAHPAPPAPAANVPTPAVMALATPAPAPSPKPAPASPPLAPPLLAPPLLAPPVLVPTQPEIVDPPFNPVPLAGGAPAYPVSLAADGRPGRVVVTCQITPDGRPQSCHTGPAKGGPAFAGAVLAWLNHGQVRYRPLTQHGRPTSGIRSWPVTLEEPAPMLAEARRRIQAAQAASAEAATAQATGPAPAPAVQAQLTPTPVISQSSVQQAAARTPAVAPSKPTLPDRPFSTRVLRGGEPEYPTVYGEGRSGSVTVTCTIQTDGAPRDCGVVRQSGGSSFGQSVQNWLRFGNVRFSPIIAGGQPVARAQTWTVTFKPPVQ